MPVLGPASTSEGVREKLITQSERVRTDVDPVQLVAAERLQSGETIRLVSGLRSSDLDVTNELVVASAARRQGHDYLLHGEVVHATGNELSSERLSMVWRLVGLADSTTTTGLPVSIDQKTIAISYPTLLRIENAQERLQTAMAIETLSLLRSSVHRQVVSLAEPHFSLGSRATRRGNELARQGNWPAAEQLWVETVDRYPGQVAAWVNAAIAAAARQDFGEAKNRASRAVVLSAISPTHRRIAQETLVWLELRQLEYHQAFGLPDPINGWRTIRGEADIGKAAGLIY